MSMGYIRWKIKRNLKGGVGETLMYNYGLEKFKNLENWYTKISKREAVIKGFKLSGLLILFFAIDSKNLFITGSSVFNTVGYANPTYTIVKLSLRLAHNNTNTRGDGSAAGWPSSKQGNTTTLRRARRRRAPPTGPETAGPTRP